MTDAEVYENQPSWVAYYIRSNGKLVPVARPFEYAGNARIQRLRRQAFEAEKE